MGNDFTKLAKPSISKINPYQPGKPIEELERELGIAHIIKLASNENPLGASQKAIAAAEEAIRRMHRYPDGSGFLLKQALSRHLEIDASHITLGNGSDSLFHLIAQVFLQPEAEVVISQYGFVTYSIATLAVGGNPIIVPATQWKHDLSAMAKAITPKTRLVFIANPNNPTGTWVSNVELRKFLHAVPEHVIVVVDEAYFEYAQASVGDEYPNTLAMQASFPNLIITRTFSKVYGLAGMRVGYAISHPDIADLLNRVRPAFNVNTPAQAAAIAALEDQEHVHRGVAINKEGMTEMTTTLETLGLPFIPSLGNFLAVDMRQDGLKIYQALLREGVIVRPLDVNGMPRHLRITIGLPDENVRLIKGLRKVLSY